MLLYQKNKTKSLPPLQNPYKKQLIEIARMAHYEPIASIPAQNNEFNYTYSKDGNLKRKVKQESQLTTLQSSRGEPKHKKLPRMPTRFNKFQYLINASEQFLALDSKVQQQSTLMNSYIRSQLSQSPRNNKQNECLKPKNKERERYRAKIIKSQYSQESQDQEYLPNATPGPGQYTIDDTFKISQTRKGLTDFSFGSRNQRFVQLKKQPQRKTKKTENPQEQKPKQLTKNRKMIPFLSCSSKYQNIVPKDRIPGPQDYQLRFGIEQDLIKKIQRNFKGSFGSSDKRFKIQEQQINIGPGYYAKESNIFEQNNNLGSYYFMSRRNRFQ